MSEPKRSYFGKLDPIDHKKYEKPSVFPNEINEFMNPEPSRLMKKLLMASIQWRWFLT